RPPNATMLQNLTDPWCLLTNNFDKDHQWVFCDIDVTDSTFYDICRSQLQTLKCSSSYIIDIITADYPAKPDGITGTMSCIYNQNDCFQSDASTIQNVCAGKTSCIAYHFAKTLALYIQSINIYYMCNNDLKSDDNIRRGFIISPNFPNIQKNINFTYVLQILKSNQDMYLYIIDIDLNSPNIIGQSSTKD
ncbi:unnamed protein product, partial [Rotaria sp. Silwood2]